MVDQIELLFHEGEFLAVRLGCMLLVWGAVIRIMLLDDVLKLWIMVKERSPKSKAIGASRNQEVESQEERTAEVAAGAGPVAG